MQGPISTVMWKMATVVWVGALACCLGGSMARADCNVEMRQAAGKYHRVIKCDESKEAIDDAIARATDSCTSSTPDLESVCYDAVAESFRLRREAMLRRALKDGASVKAAAELYGYTEEQVERWIANNAPTDRGYPEPEEIPAAVLQAEQDLEMIRAMAERQAASR